MIEQQGRLEISRGRVLRNLETVRGRLGKGVKICATVKANAYGHGVGEIARILRQGGLEWVAVYSLEEEMDVGAPPWMGVLVLAPFVVGEEGLTVEVVRGLRPQVRLNMTDERSAVRLSEARVKAGCEERLNVHVQVDTGLTRGGVDLEKTMALVETIAGLDGLQLEGIFAHLSHGDEKGHATIEEQVRRLKEVAAVVRRKVPGLMVHVQNSGGVWNVGDVKGLDMVRVGIALYGLQPNLAEPVEGLLPVARLVAPVLAIHERAAGVGVGYGHTFVTKRASRLAIVPVGYAEGYPRGMSNLGVVQVRGVEVPVVGRVSMDQIVVDVTDVPGVGVGDEVTVISWDAQKANCVDRIAQAMGTIGYEIATGFGSRLKRVVVE